MPHVFVSSHAAETDAKVKVDRSVILDLVLKRQAAPLSAPAADADALCASDNRRAKEKALQKAKGSAGGMLLRRPHSEAELRAKLTDRGHPEDAIDAAIARLQELVRLALHPCSLAQPQA